MGKKRKPEVIIVDDSDEDGRPKPLPKAPAVSKKSTAKAQAPKRQLQTKIKPTQAGISALTFTSSQPSTSAGDQPRPPTASVAGSSQQPPKEAGRWAQRHQPAGREALVIHKDKVNAVDSWLLAQLQEGSVGGSHCLLITGPPGSGKSTVVQTLAQHHNCSVIDWQPPVPTLWHEFRHNEGANIPYASKLDQFDDFVAHTKLAALPLEAASAQSSEREQPSQRSNPRPPSHSLVLVRDLPYAAGAQRQRLLSSLGSLVRSSQTPIIMLVTTADVQAQDRPAGGLQGSTRSSGSFHRELVEVITGAGAVHIAFNALADTFMIKALQRLAEQEGLQLAKPDAKALAERAAGDLSHAVEMLQLACAGKTGGPPPRIPAAKKRKAASSKSDEALMARLDAMGGRDVRLSMFRALGKVLYNKRDDGQSGPSEPETSGISASFGLQCPGVQIADRLKRRRSLVDPEGVLLHSGIEAASAAGFLHENLLHFISEDAIEDAATACQCLSDTDRILGSHAGMPGADWDADDYPSASMGESAAGSVLVRGLLHANSHPKPHTFYHMKAPAWWAARRAMLANLDTLHDIIWCSRVQGEAGCGSVREFSSSVLPFLRTMASLPAGIEATSYLPSRWWRLWNGQVLEDVRNTPHAPAQGHMAVAEGPGVGQVTEADVVDDEIEE